eukprot:Lankesteria_metandrocarpae@DN5114_c0_g1_i1.p1
MSCDGVRNFCILDLLDEGAVTCEIYWRVGVGSYVSVGETVGRVSFPENPQSKLLSAPVSGEVLHLAPTTESFARCQNTTIISIAVGECSHRITVMGLCAQCGASVAASDATTYGEDACSANDQQQCSGAQYVAPGFVCNDGNLQVSQEFALALEKERGLHLTDKRQLCLVIDLDNTLIHAFPQPPHPSLKASVYQWNNPILRLKSDEDPLSTSLGGCPCMNLGRHPMISRGVEVKSVQSDIHRPSKCLWDAVQVGGVDVPLSLRRFQIPRKQLDTYSDCSGYGALLSETFEPPVLKRVGDSLNTPPGARDNPIKRRRRIGSTRGDALSEKESPLESLLGKESPLEKVGDAPGGEESGARTPSETDTAGESIDASIELAQSVKPECSMDAVADHQEQRDSSHPHYGDFADGRITNKIDFLESNVVVVPTQSRHGDYLTYFKVRPGAIRFLSSTIKTYEMYLFTMGTTQHALSALEVLDPLGYFFGNRVFSRDAVKRMELNGVTMLGAKDLCTIFPFDQKRVVVVDDTEHAWKVLSTSTLDRQESVLKSLIKVQGYYWFPEFRLNADGSAHLGSEHPGALLRQYARQSSVGYRALMERRRKAMTSSTEVAPVTEESAVTSELITTEKSPDDSNDSVDVNLADQDIQMELLTEMLENLHSVYYKLHDNAADDPNADAGIIIAAERQCVLAGVHLSATGFRQQRVDFLGTDLARWARLLGAIVTETPLDSTTHVLVGGSTQNYQKLRHSSSYCVHPSWVEACLYTLRRVPEQKFLYSKDANPNFWEVLARVEFSKLDWPSAAADGNSLGDADDKSDEECDLSLLEGELLESFF